MGADLPCDRPGIIIYLTKGKEIVKALYKPIPRDNLDNLILTFRKPLEIVPGKDNFREKLKSFDLAAGKKLSDLLLSDVLENLPKQVPLLIVPDDSLGMLPFEILTLNSKGSIKTDKDLPYISGAEFFGDRNVISYCQSVTALTLSRIHSKSKGPEAGLLAIADPVFRERDDRASTAQKKALTGVLTSLFRRLMAAEENDQMGGLKFRDFGSPEIWQGPWRRCTRRVRTFTRASMPAKATSWIKSARYSTVTIRSSSLLMVISVRICRALWSL